MRTTGGNGERGGSGRRPRRAISTADWGHRFRAPHRATLAGDGNTAQIIEHSRSIGAFILQKDAQLPARVVLRKPPKFTSRILKGIFFDRNLKKRFHILAGDRGGQQE